MPAALTLYRQEGHEQGLAEMLNGVGWMTRSSGTTSRR